MASILQQLKPPSGKGLDLLEYIIRLVVNVVTFAIYAFQTEGRIKLRKWFLELRTIRKKAPLTKGFGTFYQRHLYSRIQDCWNRPICSSPSSWTDVLERKKNPQTQQFELTGKSIRALNCGSYNYQGFAGSNELCIDDVLKSLGIYGIGACTSRSEAGTTQIVSDLEKEIADFLHCEKSFVFSMGFATNSTSIDILSGPDSLVISDRDNHASIAVGRKFSGASIDTFVHNSAEDLERVIRRNIARGNINKARRLSSKGEPVPYVPWKKILIVVEGTYSMSGEFPPLADIVRIKKKYGCYL
ncbi:hypothetical protein ADUPG1_009493, partial [Aduncisulcus paluster]